VNRIAISTGCPAGIGAEVSVVAAYANRNKLLSVLYGDHATLKLAWDLRKLPQAKLVFVQNARSAVRSGYVYAVATGGTALREVDRLRATAKAGRAQLEYLDAALASVRAGECAALCTAPISKDAVVRGGVPTFRGHTEYLQDALDAQEVVMAFASDKLTTALVTTHMPLADVPRSITPARVATSIYWLCHFLTKLGHKAPRIAVCGLNPHAGENGLLGSEERQIVRGIRSARLRAARSQLQFVCPPPLPAETAFRLAVRGDYDGVVAMYHDQATIPMKVASFGEAVNVSLGLPIIRTSVDHGTAYDRAWKGTADQGGMHAALALADKLAATARHAG
jgi:4-hydroxythreonine-4-phosphate dehydrogenase